MVTYEKRIMERNRMLGGFITNQVHMKLKDGTKKWRMSLVLLFSLAYTIL